MVLGLMLSMALAADAPVQLPMPPREFRAAWVATVANIDWPSRPGLPVATQRNELNQIVDMAARMGLNALIFQIRPHADAMYPSELEPWSEYLTGECGKAPNPMWDPLQEMIERCHEKGLELHVWLNPYRAWHGAAKGPRPASHISRRKPHLVKPYGTFLWMDPGEPEVQQHTLAVVEDILKRYDVDGIHIDDYFYPYPIAGTPFPDDASWQKSLAENHGLSRNDWRRRNVDVFVKRLYDTIKQHKPWVKFGISPFGIYRPGIPPGIQAGVDQYDGLYADALKWFEQGWCDYFTPQLYWPIRQRPQSYPVLLEWWKEQNRAGRHLWPGNFTSRLNPNDGNWALGEILEQIEITRRTLDEPGNVHFSWKAFGNNWKGSRQQLQRGLYATPALIPASPWLADKPAGAPPVVERRGGHVHFQPPTGTTPMAFLVWEREGETWGPATIVPRTARQHPVQSTAKEIAVAVVDRVGQVSAPVFAGS